MTGTFATLGEVSQFINGAAFKPEDWGDVGSKIIRIQNLTDPTKPFNRTTRQVDEKLHVHPGDILVSWSATLGVYEWKNSEIGLLNQHIFRVVPDSGVVEKRYLKHALELALFDMRKHLHGATMMHVNRGEFLSTKLYLPSLAEQRRIATILDLADAIRAKHQQAIVHLDQLVRGLFIDMFGEPLANPKKWPRIAFGELLENIDSGKSPVCLDRSAVDDEWAVLKLGAITRCEYNDAENKALPLGVKPDPKLEVKVGDLLFTRKNTYELVGACVLVGSTKPKLLLPDLIFRFRLRDDARIDPCYLHQLLIYPSKRQQIQKLAGGSSGSMPNISKARLQGAMIEVPPLAMQTKFRNLVGNIEKLKMAHRASLLNLDKLFASLQHRAFRGEL